jgi:ubiquinone/menaquinone biosynthesis C-methylase UbiE
MFRILDVGCGTKPKGDVNVDLYLTPEHREKGEGLINTKKIENFILADVDSDFLPFRDSSFEIVFGSHILEHCKSPFRLLLECKRVARKIVYLEIPVGSRNPYISYHLYSWDRNTFSNLLHKVFTKCDIYYSQKSPRIKEGSFRNVFSFIVRVFWKIITYRTQLTAICYK